MIQVPSISDESTMNVCGIYKSYRGSQDTRFDRDLLGSIILSIEDFNPGTLCMYQKLCLVYVGKELVGYLLTVY